MGFFKKTGANFYKITVTLLAILFVIYILVEIRLWSMDWTEHFLKRAGWLEIIFVSLVVAGASMVLLKLLQLHLRMQTGGR
jgi:hypothetical protein